MEQAPDPSLKCSHCSVPILDRDRVRRDHGQWYHVQCARILSSYERVSESRGLQRVREAKIAQNRERLAAASDLPDEPPAILCVICRMGIGNTAELAITDSGPTHVRCRPPVESTHDREPRPREPRLLDGTYQ